MTRIDRDDEGVVKTYFAVRNDSGMGPTQMSVGTLKVDDDGEHVTSRHDFDDGLPAGMRLAWALETLRSLGVEAPAQPAEDPAPSEDEVVAPKVRKARSVKP